MLTVFKISFGQDRPKPTCEVFLLPMGLLAAKEQDQPDRVAYDKAEGADRETVRKDQERIVIEPSHRVHIETCGDSNVQVNLHGECVDSIPVQEAI